jgi:nucleoside-diphosphate-sugar epimerase
MSRILIAGCGYVGQATADLFHAAGWELEGWVSSPESAAKLSGKPYPVILVDIALRDQVNARPENFDAVILCASTHGGEPDVYRRLYLNGARNLLDRFVGSTIAFTSSTSVYGQQDGSWVTEESETKPMRETGRILLETEKLVLGGGGIVARLAGIYGPGRSALLTKFWTGEASVDPGNDHLINQVHRDDIAAALFLLLDRQSSARQIYNVVDDQPVLQSECYRWLSGKLNRPLPSIGNVRWQSKRGKSNKRVSNTKLRTLGWKLRYPTFAEAMEKSILPGFSQRSV